MDFTITTILLAQGAAAAIDLQVPGWSAADIRLPLIVETNKGAFEGAQFTLHYTSGLSYNHNASVTATTAAIGGGSVIRSERDGNLYIVIFASGINPITPVNGKAEIGSLVFDYTGNEPQTVNVSQLKLVRLINPETTESEYLEQIDFNISRLPPSIDIDLTGDAAFVKDYGDDDPDRDYIEETIQAMVIEQLVAQELPENSIIVYLEEDDDGEVRKPGESVAGSPYEYYLNWTYGYKVDSAGAGASPGGGNNFYELNEENVNINAELKIKPIPASVTANNASKVAGANDPAFSATTAGFKPGEAPEPGNYSVTRPRAGLDEAAGVYAGAIVVEAASEYDDSNYIISWNPGNFTITAPGNGNGNGNGNGGPGPGPGPAPTTAPTSAPTTAPTSNPPGPGPTNPPTDIIDNGEIPVGPVFTDAHVSYMIGYPEGDIRPEANITRAEAVTAFYRLLTEKMRKDNWSTDNNFPDVDPDAWYNAAVSVMTGIGVIKGHDDGNFAPDDHITRAELAAVAARFAALMDLSGNGGAAFSDISGHWAAENIIYVSSVGWLVGYPDGTFLPDQLINRAEFMTMVNRMLKRVPESVEDILTGEMLSWTDNADPNAWYYLAVQEATNSHTASSKDTEVPLLGFAFEKWTGMTTNPDWLALEAAWQAGG